MEAPTFFLVGDVWDNRYLVDAAGAPAQYGGPDMDYEDGEDPAMFGVDSNDDYDEMARMDEWVRQPALARRVPRSDGAPSDPNPYPNYSTQ